MKKFVLSSILLLCLAMPCWAATVYKYVTTAGAGAKDGAAWASAYGMAEFRDYLQDSAPTDLVCYVQSGTYTFGEAIAFYTAGTATTPVKIIGVNSGTTATETSVSATTDYAYGSNRPVFAMEGNAFVAPAYAILMNLNFTMTNANMDLVTLGTNGYIYNCYVYNNSSTNGKYAIKLANYSSACNCEARCTNGQGIGLSTYCYAVSCYIHDCSGASGTGLYFGGNGAVANGCIIDTCTLGMSFGGNGAQHIINNIIYNSTSIGIKATSATNMCFINNIISQCAIGLQWSANSGYLNLWKNNLLNNTDDIDGTTVTLDASNLLLGVATPCMVDPANGDFRLNYAAARSAGLQLTTNDGLSVAGFHQNIGVDQKGDFPTAANVLKTATVDGVPGTYHIPGDPNVLSSCVYGAADARNGTYNLPLQNHILHTGSAYYGVTGSLVDGTCTIPAAANVWYGSGTYGVAGTDSTPTKRASSITNCSAGNIKNTVVIDDVTGTYEAVGGGGGFFGPRIRIGH
jgi:hypothetical protein